MGRITLRLLAALAMVLAGSASAQNAGQVQFASGSATIERGAQRIPALPAETVQVGDSVVTGDDGHIQLRMVDEAHVSVRPRSRMRIDDYRHDREQPARSSALLRLVGGVIRTFTGEIAEGNRANYRMVTPLASVGIRGSGNILAHLEGQGTVNHTLTGAHGVSSLDPAFSARTLVSHGGQTIQVLPGQAPRYIPTPRFIIAAATNKPAAAKSDEKSGSEPEASGGDVVTALAGEASASGVATTAAQATTVTSGASLGSFAGATGREALYRFFMPIGVSGTFEGVIAQTRFEGVGGALVNTDGELTGVRNGLLAAFLSGSGALPGGWEPRNFTGNATFSGGTHHDGFISPDGTLVMGRWEGATISIANPEVPGEGASFDLGPRSAAYIAFRPTTVGIWSTFTGSTNYTLAAAVAPTDGDGRAGSVTNASTSLNFSTNIATGQFGIDINRQQFIITGSAEIDRSGGLFQWAFFSGGQNIDIVCSGSNCSPTGYISTFNGNLAGSQGDWIIYSYRINQVRSSGGGFPDFVVGAFALNATNPPGAAISLPRSGTLNFALTGPVNAGSATTGVNTFGPPVNGDRFPNQVSGTLQANFSSQTVAFDITVGSNNPAPGPTYRGTASNVPLVGAGFSAVANAAPTATAGTVTIACTGSPCGTPGSTLGRFDGFFTNSSGTAGQVQYIVGDSLGQYLGASNFAATGALARSLAAADARAMPGLASLHPMARANVGPFSMRYPRLRR